MGAYDWEEERGTFARAASALGEERALDLLDQAAEAARSGDLRKAAGILEEIRAAVVTSRLFHQWDNGIWCFTSLIRFIRQMSPETAVPKEYQRLLDAIPSARFDEDMTSPQKAFWYGSPREAVGGTLHLVDHERKADPPGRRGWGCALLLALAALAVTWFLWK
ncbi:MAG TPA: hypothetical protein VF804_14225 [Holophagaceae bacterium]